MKTSFTIEEIKKYLITQDSMGDILYNLSAENIFKANMYDNGIQIYDENDSHLVTIFQDEGIDINDDDEIKSYIDENGF